MRVTQRIPKVGGGHITLRTDASLRFTDVGEYSRPGRRSPVNAVYPACNWSDIYPRRVGLPFTGKGY